MADNTNEEITISYIKYESLIKDSADLSSVTDELNDALARIEILELELESEESENCDLRTGNANYESAIAEIQYAVRGL
jgi:hypothetical protein